jgi:hypothetical protein
MNVISQQKTQEIARLQQLREAALATGLVDDVARLDHQIRGLEKEVKALSVNAMDCKTPQEFEASKRAFLQAAGDNKLPTGGNRPASFEHISSWKRGQ